MSYSGGVSGEQQRPGRLRDSRGAAGQGETGEALGSEKDQASGHDNTLTAGTSGHESGHDSGHDIRHDKAVV